jgi:hypothetical protein
MDGNLTYLESIGRPYKVYTALLTQTGTDAPVDTVLENTLGEDIVWERNGIGDYSGLFSLGFDVSKTIILHGSEMNGFSIPYLYSTSGGINIYTYLILDGSSVDNELYNLSIEIRVYP